MHISCDLNVPFRNNAVSGYRPAIRMSAVCRIFLLDEMQCQRILCSADSRSRHQVHLFRLIFLALSRAIMRFIASLLYCPSVTGPNPRIPVKCPQNRGKESSHMLILVPTTGRRAEANHESHRKDRGWHKTEPARNVILFLGTIVALPTRQAGRRRLPTYKAQKKILLVGRGGVSHFTTQLPLSGPQQEGLPWVCRAAYAYVHGRKRIIDLGRSRKGNGDQVYYLPQGSFVFPFLRLLPTRYLY